MGHGRSKPPYKVMLKVVATGLFRGRQVRVEASPEHEVSSSLNTSAVSDCI
jgi:hypothetical protein